MFRGDGSSRWILLAGWLWTAFLDCGGELGASHEPEPDGGPLSTVPDDAISQIAQAYCDGMVPCCSKGSFAADQGACVAWAVGQLDTEFTAEESPNVVFHPESVAACAGAVHARASLCIDPDVVGVLTIIGEVAPLSTGNFIQAPSVSVCNEVLHGDLGPGAACAGILDCGPFGSCFYEVNQGQLVPGSGRCVAGTPPSACSATRACSPGQTCVVDDCETPPAPRFGTGQPCQGYAASGRLCVDGYDCILNGYDCDTTTGTACTCQLDTRHYRTVSPYSVNWETCRNLD